jgi:hypothetical protein
MATKAVHRSTKSFKVSMKPSTISQISLEGEDHLLSLIHQLNGLAQSGNESEERETFDQLSNSSKKDLARTLIRNDRRISNQQKQERFLQKQIEKETRAEQRNLQKNVSLDSEITLLVRLESFDQLKTTTLDRFSTLAQLTEACQRLFDLSETNLIIYFRSKALVESDILAIPSGSLLSLRSAESRNLEDSAELLPVNIGLPILHEPVKRELLEEIDQNSVVVLVGETGCG